MTCKIITIASKASLPCAIVDPHNYVFIVVYNMWHCCCSKHVCFLLGNYVYNSFSVLFCFCNVAVVALLMVFATLLPAVTVD